MYILSFCSNSDCNLLKNSTMKSVLLILSFISFYSVSQPLKEYNQTKNKIDKKLILSLGTWATTNFVVSGIGWATTPKGEAFYFHQMNVLWNSVNIGLAIPGYFSARKATTNLTLAATIRKQHQTEKIFLINTTLDVAYISSGLMLRNEAKTNFEKHNQFNGYGNSLLLQGSFLFIFDLTAYLVHNSHSKKSLNKLMNSIEMSSTGLGLKWNFGMKPVFDKSTCL